MFWTLGRDSMMLPLSQSCLPFLNNAVFAQQRAMGSMNEICARQFRASQTRPFHYPGYQRAMHIHTPVALLLRPASGFHHQWRDGLYLCTQSVSSSCTDVQHSCASKLDVSLVICDIQRLDVHFTLTLIVRSVVYMCCSIQRFFLMGFSVLIALTSVYSVNKKIKWEHR